MSLAHNEKEIYSVDAVNKVVTNADPGQRTRPASRSPQKKNPLRRNTLNRSGNACSLFTLT